MIPFRRPGSTTSHRPRTVRRTTTAKESLEPACLPIRLIAAHHARHNKSCTPLCRALRYAHDHSHASLPVHPYCSRIGGRGRPGPPGPALRSPRPSTAEPDVRGPAQDTFGAQRARNRDSQRCSYGQPELPDQVGAGEAVIGGDDHPPAIRCAAQNGPTSPAPARLSEPPANTRPSPASPASPRTNRQSRRKQPTLANHSRTSAQGGCGAARSPGITHNSIPAITQDNDL